jgi:hypothetical protein
MTIRRSLASPLAICLIGLVLGACGGDDKTDATSTSLPPTPTVSNDPTTSATLAPGEVTAGQIADRIASAWPTVTSYRSITRIIPASGTPEATPAIELAGRAERHVILPDQKQIVITDQGATTEIVLVNGVLSKRTTSPGGSPGGWQIIDPATVSPNDPFGRTYETILAPETPPYSGLSGRQRDRIGTEQGQSTIDGRACNGYLFPEVTETGERIQVIVYLDNTDLPCRIETRAGLTISQTDYVFNKETAFATPIAATPAASPVASPEASQAAAVSSSASRPDSSSDASEYPVSRPTYSRF